MRGGKGAHSTTPSPGGKTQKRPNIRIVILGVGNVASALVQALCLGELAGEWHEKVGGYNKGDITIVGAFDVDRRKVGRDLAEGIFAAPNVTPRFSNVTNIGVQIQPGIANEEVPEHLSENSSGTDKFPELLKACSADVVLNLIPSGMQVTSRLYCEASLLAGCSFVNATPATIANDPTLARKFGRSRLVLAGDDLLSQFGGTAFHKGILEFMNRRGLAIEKSYQLDVGGGSETLNTIDESVKLGKRSIKTEAISEEIPYSFDTVAGTTDYVDYMGNDRTSYFWIQARTAFGSKIKVDVYLRTNDGANATNVLIDVIRAVASARNDGRYGVPGDICAYGFKKFASPVHLREAQDEFLASYG